MTRYSLLITLIFSFVGFSQINKVDQKGWKQGAWVKYYPESKVAIYQGQFKDNKPFGEFRYYFASGKVKIIIQHRDQNRSDAWFYFESESLMAEGQYLNFKKDSIWTNYNEQGLLISREVYKDDKLNGLKVTYYLEGQITEKEIVLTIENFKDSLLDGTYESFYMKGNRKEKGTYTKNMKNGEWLTFHTNGKIAVRSNYKNDLLHGWVFSYDVNGHENGKIYYFENDLYSGSELDKLFNYFEKKGIDPNN